MNGYAYGPGLVAVKCGTLCTIYVVFMLPPGFFGIIDPFPRVITKELMVCLCFPVPPFLHRVARSRVVSSLGTEAWKRDNGSW